MLIDVMKELREEGRPISIGRLFAITVSITKVHVLCLGRSINFYVVTNNCIYL